MCAFACAVVSNTPCLVNYTSMLYLLRSPQAVFFAVSCFALHHKPPTVKAGSYTHAHTPQDNLPVIYSCFYLVFTTGQPEDPRLRWELAPGPSLQLRLNSSRPWWLQLMVSPLPSLLLRFISKYIRSLHNLCKSVGGQSCIFRFPSEAS